MSTLLCNGGPEMLRAVGGQTAFWNLRRRVGGLKLPGCPFCGGEAVVCLGLIGTVAHLAVRCSKCGTLTRPMEAEDPETALAACVARWGADSRYMTGAEVLLAPAHPLQSRTKPLQAERNDMTLERKDYILGDEELRELADSTPYPEGGLLEEFLAEAAVVMEAVKIGETNCNDRRAQLLAVMRAFYFLGIRRGGEAYRSALQNAEQANGAEDVPPLSFTLDGLCADLFGEDLSALTLEGWEQISKTFYNLI